MTTIRMCRIDDANALQEINRSEMGYDHPPELTRENLSRILSNDSHRIFIAEIDGKVAGYVHACDYDLIYASPMKNIMGIAVLGEYRRKGIGSALLQSVEEWAAQTGACAVRLVSGATRTEAHDFYRRLGYGQGRDQLNFKKYLNGN